MQYKKKVPVHFFQCNLFGLSGCQFVTCLPIFSHPWLHIFDGLKKGGVSTNRIAESAESPDLFRILGAKASRVHSLPLCLCCN